MSWESETHGDSVSTAKLVGSTGAKWVRMAPLTLRNEVPEHTMNLTRPGKLEILDILISLAIIKHIDAMTLRQENQGINLMRIILSTVLQIIPA